MGDKNGLGETLWASVAELMNKRYGEINVTRLGAKGRGAGIGGSASRIKAGQTSIGLDVLMKVAKHFGVETYMLLVPDKELRQFFLNHDKELRRIARIYAQTDEVGRQTITTAIQIAEERARNAQAPGLGKARKAER